MKLQIQQPKEVLDISNFPKSMKIVDLKTIQTCSRGKQKQISWSQMILGKIKIKRRVQNFKNLGKQLQLQQMATTW